MVSFELNGERIDFSGDENLSLLNFLRLEKHITSVKDGCSAQSYCGACMVEIDGEPKLSCVTKLGKLQGKKIITTEGIPAEVLDIIAKSFVEKGAVQCGFCTPGFIMRTKILFQQNPDPTREEIVKALNINLCRCTGYVKIMDAIVFALKNLREKKAVEMTANAGVGASYPKYEAYETAIGKRKFVNDIFMEGMVFGALKFSDYPKTEVISVDVSEALKLQGVHKILFPDDVPGNRYTGLIYPDWPLMIAKGETTRYIGDVICSVVAESEALARQAVSLIHVEYKVFEPVTDPYLALEKSATQVHPNHVNLLDNCIVRRGGSIDDAFKNSAFRSGGFFKTQRIEHAFLEPEAAVAFPYNDGVKILSQGQGVYVDRKQIASLLNLPPERVEVELVPCGGGFGGKEDLTVQGHVALMSYITGKAVKLCLSRDESIRMHPKRHPVFMDIEIACDADGMLTALKLRAVGDTGAYASVGTKVLERVAGHASGAYHFPVVDIEAKTVYTNNIPSGAMRGFGANQVNFALESCIDELCRQGGFDRWEFRYKNVLEPGKMTATGQVLESGVGLKASLLAIKEQFLNAKYAGIACGIKNCGIGNGMVDYSDAIIEIAENGKVVVKHGWTDMGQGINNVVIQLIAENSIIKPENITVEISTEAGIETGMTTSSRATVLLGNAVLDACKNLNAELEHTSLDQLCGKVFTGYSECDWTTKPGADVEKIVTHFSYGYAAQLVILDDTGKISKVVAAHDAGKIMNKTLFEGQIEGGVVMGLGYALSEDLPMENGFLKSTRLKDCGLFKAKDVPEIEVIGIEVPDDFGPYGAKGVGEIGLVPTAAAVACAMNLYHKKMCYELPLKYDD